MMRKQVTSTPALVPCQSPSLHDHPYGHPRGPFAAVRAPIRASAPAACTDAECTPPPQQRVDESGTIKAMWAPDREQDGLFGSVQASCGVGSHSPKRKGLGRDCARTDIGDHMIPKSDNLMPTCTLQSYISGGPDLQACQRINQIKQAHSSLASKTARGICMSDQAPQLVSGCSCCDSLMAFAACLHLCFFRLLHPA